MKFDIQSSLAVLSRTPGTLRTLLLGLDDSWTRHNEGPETFSPFDVVGHLIDGEETDWIPRAEIILSRSADAAFEPYDRFRHFARNREKSLATLFDEFESLRAGNIERVRSWNLSESDLDLTAKHPGLGRVTLRQLLAAWVVHDLGHIAQASRVMAKQYREETGPWVEYLPVLTDRERQS